MKKRVLSLFMALALCLTMLPTAALAEEAGAAPDTGNVESVYTIGDDTVVQIGEESDPVQVAQALIDALPEDVTAENAEEIEQQLMALEAALEALTEEQLALLDMTRYEALCAALVSQVSLTAERGGEHADHPICGAAHTDIGDHTGECANVTWTAWDGTSDIVYDSSNTAYVYLSGNAERTETLAIADGYTLYLCLNGYSLTKTTEDSNPSFEGIITIYKGAQFTLCDCRGGGKITHAEGVLGRGVRCGDSSGSATFAMFGGEISGNRVGSTSGAGQDGAGVEVHNAIFNMYGGRIADNHVEKTSNDGGGGVHAYGSGSFTMYSGEISGNTSAGDGGGVSVVAASFTMKGGSITNNTASAGDGGGAALYNDTFELSGGTISDNSATKNGGGLYYYHYQSAPLTVSGSVNITGNKQGTADSNVYLTRDKYLVIGAKGLKADAKIGVTYADPIASGSYVTVARGANKGYTEGNITSDAGGTYSILREGDTVNLYNGLPHEHPICGATHTAINGHTGECSNVKWTAWDGVSDITYDENNTAYVYLTTNAERDSALEIANGYTLYLCLSGHSLTKNKAGKSVIKVGDNATLSLCDCSDAQSGKLTHGTTASGLKYTGHGVSLGYRSTFNMYGGNITGNRASYGGGVTIDEEYSNATFNLYGGSITDNATTGGDGGGGVHALFGTFTMYGGSITGNNAENATYGGGGVYAGSRTGEFYMKGGSITGNTAKNGGGVYVYKSSEFYVSGSVDITGNKNTLGIDENVYLRSGASFEIDTDGLNADAKIGVTAANDIASGKYVTVATGANYGYTEGNITSDAGGTYSILREGDNVNLYNGLHKHPVCGAACGHTDEHTGVKWTAISSLSQINGAGYYYLTADVTTDNVANVYGWEPVDGVVLCLNGKKITGSVGGRAIRVLKDITFTLTDCAGGGRLYNGAEKTQDQRGVEVAGGTFNMYGGKITGFHSSGGANGGGVLVRSDGASLGVFNMYGGSIVGNYALYGGGVSVGYYAASPGEFNMYGGSITGNTAHLYGGGVYAYRTCTINISGNVKITGNIKDRNNVRTDNNVYLVRNKTITVTGPLTGGADSIGVTTTDSLISGCFIAIANGTDSYTLTDNEKGAFSEDEGSRFTSKLLRDNTLLLTRFSDIPMHDHALCGAFCEDGKYADELWQPLTYYSSSQDLYCGPAEASRSTRSGYTADNKETKYYTYTIPSGNYYLTEDLTLGGDGGSITGGTLVISGDVKLCLNGKTLSTTLAAYSINVIRVDLDSSLTLCDCSPDGSGKITSENKVYNCVQPYGGQNTGKASGKFTMYGGTLTGAYNGVVLNDADSVALYGGTITGNTVGVSANHPVTIGGTVNITGNTYADVRLLNKSTTGLIQIDPSLTQGSRIGVSSEQELSETIPSVKIATGARGTLDYKLIFTPNVIDQGYIITRDDAGDLYLTKHTHDWTYTANGETKTITATCSNADGNCPLDGDGGSVTLKAPTGTLIYTGMDQPATLENNLKTGDEAPTIIYTYERNGISYSIENGGLPKNADTYTASITLGDQSVSVQYTINKADLTIKAKDNAIVYGDTASDKGVTYSGFVNGENESVLGGELTYTFSYTLGSDTGLYIIMPEGKTSGNYDITFTTGTLTVEPRTVTLTWYNYENRTYGDGKYVYATAGNLLEADVGKVQVNVMGNGAQVSGKYTATAIKLTGYEAHNYKLPTTGLTQEYTIGLAAQTLTFAKTGDQSVTYGDTLENPATNNRADGSEVTYTSSNETVATVDENGTVTARNVGTTTITATAEAMNGKYSEAKASYKLTVNPKELKANDLELTGSFVKTYDGNVNATAVGARVKSGVLVGNDTLNITGSAVYNSEDVKDANSITFTPNAITEGNYRLAAAEKVTVTEGVKINRRTITIASVQATSKQYDGDTTAYSCITSVTFNGLVEGETLTKSGLQNETYVTGDYGINSANFNSANVNEANKITGEVGITNPNLNYTFKESGKETSTAPFTTTGSITPANSWSLTPVTDLTIRYNNRDLRTYTPNWSTLLPSGQTWTYSASTATTGSAALSTNTIGADTGVLSYQLSAGNVGDTATWTVTASCANYQSFTLAVTLTLIARDEQTGFKFENNTTSVTKTYGDEDFTIAASGGATGSSVTYTSSDETVAKVDEDGKVTIVGAGITTIKAKASETADFEEKEISYTLTVKPKTLAKDDLTYSGSITKVYDGSTNAPSGLTVSVDPSSLVNGDTLTVNGTLKFNSANVGEASEITFIPTAITTGNYTLAATEALTIRSASITAKEVTLTSGINATNRSYAKDNKTVALTKGTLAFTGLVSGETLDVNIPDTGTIFDTKVGTYNVTYSGVTLKDGTTGKASNYKLVGSLPTVTVTISKAAAPVLADIPVSFKYTVTTGEKAIGNAGIPADAGTLTYSKGTATKTGTVTVTSWDVDSTTGKVTYTLSGGKAGDSATLFVTIASTNYEDATVNVVITLTARDNQVELRITGGTTVVYGQTLALNTSGGSGSGAVTYTVVNGTGEATIDPNTGVLTPVKVGSVSVIATKAGDNDYNAVTSAPVEITITKATPTGEPKYTEIKTGGKTLADAALTIEGSTLKPNAGTLEWVDDKGNVLSNDTKVEANTTYKWLFTPTDANYTTLTGSIELYHKSSSSGGWYYTYYTIKATAGTNGSISPSGWTSVRDGRDQTFTITPDKGYAVAKVLVDGKSVGAVKSYTFKNVTKDHTIEAIFMKSNGNPQTGVFVDVAEGSYYEEAIDWAVEKGITNGVSSNMFAPNDPCTRAQIVTFLWRAAGSPAPKSMSSFTDVPADAFYAKAVAWAVENGITSGTGESKFSPNSTCTRAQAVTFLYRASGSPAVSGKAEFSDVSTTAFYADAVAWAAKKGITTGIGGGLFGSDNDCTRGQIVTFLWRAMAE